MSTAPQRTLDTQEYRDQMQRAATAYLQRHAHEHLEDAQLLERATLHLTQALEVPVFMAQRLVELAFTRLRESHWLQVNLADAPSPDAICLVDCRNGQAIFVHRRILPDAFLARFTTP